ncbi:MAG: adenosylcobinamide-phosphate synthase CbiB [Actinomycetota bacterium]
MIARPARRCLGVAAGLALDRVAGDPTDELHPVAWFGSAMQRVEAVTWADRRAAGVVYASVGVGLGALAGVVARSVTVVVATTVAGRQLRGTAASIGGIAATDVDAARRKLRSLVGRDPSELDAGGVAAAAIESVAENSVDAVVAPVFWALVAGAPGAAAYRAINTMDAMVGHRSARYRSFGWAAARLDDVANYVPARIFAALVALHVPSAARAIWTATRVDASAHPSPNAGVAEAAMAAALGVELGGTLRYGERVEHRPALGSGVRPAPADVARAVRLADAIERTIAVATAGVGVAAVVSRVVVPRGRQRSSA